MSTFAIEKAFWTIGNHPHEAQAYMANPDEYLMRYQLSAEEKALIKNLDVHALDQLGINTVLMVNTWSALKGGPAALGEYLQKMAGARPA